MQFRLIIVISSQKLYIFLIAKTQICIIFGCFRFYLSGALFGPVTEFSLFEFSVYFKKLLLCHIPSFFCKNFFSIGTFSLRLYKFREVSNRSVRLKVVNRSPTEIVFMERRVMGNAGGNYLAHFLQLLCKLRIRKILVNSKKFLTLKNFKP